jgi:hypothetical protein
MFSMIWRKLAHGHFPVKIEEPVLPLPAIPC